MIDASLLAITAPNPALRRGQDDTDEDSDGAAAPDRRAGQRRRARCVEADPQYVRQHLGYLPQEVGFYKSLNAYDLLDYIGTMKNLSRTQRREQVARVLEPGNLNALKSCFCPSSVVFSKHLPKIAQQRRRAFHVRQKIQYGRKDTSPFNKRFV